MKETEFIWQNGNLVPWSEAKVHVLTHTLHYGGGAFEGIRFYRTDKGPAIFRLDEHIDRLFYSASVLDMEIPYTKAQVKQAIIDVVRVNNLEEGYIRPLVFYGYGKMGANPKGNPVELIVATWPWGSYLAHEVAKVKTSKYIRIHPDSTVADAKLCGHYLNSILALLELKGTAYDEALFLDSQGYVMEGSGENFFMVKDGIIYTPQLGGILSGITRETVIELAKHLGLEVIEKGITLPEVYQADEAFFTGTAAEVNAIGFLDDKRIGTGQIGAVTERIKQEYQSVIHGRNADYQKFLTYIPKS